MFYDDTCRCYRVSGGVLNGIEKLRNMPSLSKSAVIGSITKLRWQHRVKSDGNLPHRPVSARPTPVSIKQHAH